MAGIYDVWGHVFVIRMWVEIIWILQTTWYNSTGLNVIVDSQTYPFSMKILTKFSLGIF